MQSRKSARRAPFYGHCECHLKVKHGALYLSSGGPQCDPDMSFGEAILTIGQAIAKGYVPEELRGRLVSQAQQVHDELNRQVGMVVRTGALIVDRAPEIAFAPDVLDFLAPLDQADPIS